MSLPSSWPDDLASAPPVLVGIATENLGPSGRPLFNGALLLNAGTIQQAFYKTLLPTYDVFDEDRYFEPARGPQIMQIDNKTNRNHFLRGCME